MKKTEIEEIKNIYNSYKKAYKEQMNKELKEYTENIKKHVKYKFESEDKIMKKFIDRPIMENYYRISNAIFGPNEGNRYEHIKKILSKFNYLPSRR